ncbi:Putative ribosome biogenesis GTPase RsgA [Chlamydia trachomatis]|nr:Putative ribosome biogenesis GTPase RsgA [Chlamydia trachomatis]
MELRTQEISQALNRGKHTTTSSLMIPFNEGFVIDTPGFGSLDLNMTQLELANSFTDFRNNSVHCKFKNCLHTNEQNCFIKKMVDENKIYKQRYLDYLKMFSEIKK